MEEPSIEKNHIILQTTLDLLGGEARAHISQREGESGELMVEGEIVAFDLECMGRAMEAVMRRISEAAALSDAVLEMRVAREAEPKSAREADVRGLMRELSEAGFPVRADVLWTPAPWTPAPWTPAPGGDVWLGIGGDGAEALRAFVEESTVWRAL